MEPTETPAPAAGRRRPWLLIALAVLVVLFVASRFWSGSPATRPAIPSNAARTQARPGADVRVDPSQLTVHLEALNGEKPVDDEAGRNPFRFKPKPPPPPPPAPPPAAAMPYVAPPPPAPTGPPPPPPITLKFIGIVEPKPGDRVAAFSDCRATMHAREGDLVLGQYKLVRIGLESVVMEYLDGRGRQTIRLSGQECVGKT
jgi:hypothetical protein